MRSIWRAVTAGAASSALIVLGSVGAVATPIETADVLGQSDPGLVDPYEESPSAVLVPEQSGKVSTLAAMPLDCWGKTDDPHWSPKTQMASVHGRTVCDYDKAGVSVETKLYREDWWGWNLMATGYNSRANNYRSFDATPHADCGGAPTRLYRGYSTHTVIVGNGATGSASTTNNNSFACG